MKPKETKKLEGRETHHLNDKWVNVIVEPTENEGGEYVIPSYTYIKSNCKRVTIGLQNLSCRTVTLTKGTVVARLSSTNKIPDMLAPEFADSKLKFANGEDLRNHNVELVNTNSLNSGTEKPDNSWIDKLFAKLNLSGFDDWTEKQKQAVRDCIVQYNHIFAVEDLELGKTDLVKHVICLDDYTPFKERYRQIPPHQYEEVRNHLNEMLKLGVIRKSKSPWASAVVLVRKKDGLLRFSIDL